MDQNNNQEASRYTPSTESGKLLSTLLLSYDQAYEVARDAQHKLLEWVQNFVDVKVGDIVLQNRRHGKTTGFVPTIEIQGTFTGWKGNTPRMLVQEIQAEANAGLMHFARLTVTLRGVPLKNDGTPFKGAKCWVTLDVFQQAMDATRDMADGYRGYAHDVTTCYVDRKLAFDAEQVLPAGLPGAPGGHENRGNDVAVSGQTN